MISNSGFDTETANPQSRLVARRKGETLIPVDRVASRIFLIPTQKMMLDFDLADLYGVATRRLNERVTRNADRFPNDFMFRLSRAEAEAMNRSQFAAGSQKHRDPRHRPRAFTQEGVAMPSSVLRSKRAAQVNVAIMRTFVRLRRMLATNEELARKVARHDRQITVLFEQVANLLDSPEDSEKPIGFSHPKR